MTTNKPHRTHIPITLPIAVNASYRSVVAGEIRAGAMVPAEAVNWLTGLEKGGKTITMIELDGPGDPLSSWAATKECLRLLRKQDRHIPIAVTTLGLAGAERAADLAALGVYRLILRVDTISRETAARLYSWIRPGKKTLSLAQGCELLVSGQAAFCEACVKAGLQVVVRTRIVKGINEDEVAAIAMALAEKGAGSMEIWSTELDVSARINEAGRFLPASAYDPAEVLPPPGMPEAGLKGGGLPRPTEKRGLVAVASSSGMDVDLHLGQAGQLLIYGRRDDGLACLLETRQTPPAGAPDRWSALAAVLADCFCLLASHAGVAPREQLAASGIKVLLTEEHIEGVVDALFGGGKKRKCKR